jgi:hypothetical protein
MLTQAFRQFTLHLFDSHKMVLDNLDGRLRYPTTPLSEHCFDCSLCRYLPPYIDACLRCELLRGLSNNIDLCTLEP